MKLLTDRARSRHMHHTISRGVAGICAMVSGVIMLSGCANMVEAADQVALQFSADSNLLGPASSTTYAVHSEWQSPSRELETAHQVAELPTPSGTLVISNGMITSAQFVASVEAPNDIRFVLTEPALYERRGEVLESIQALGTLATNTAMYPETSLTLTPQEIANGTIVEVSFEVPESLTAETMRTSTEVNLTLFIEPIATFEGAESRSGEEARD